MFFFLLSVGVKYLSGLDGYFAEGKSSLADVENMSRTGLTNCSVLTLSYADLCLRRVP